MDKQPTKKLIAEKSGLTIDEVGTYMCDLEQRPDGNWVVYFGNEVERVPELARKLSAGKTLIIDREVANYWFDRGNG